MHALAPGEATSTLHKTLPVVFSGICETAENKRRLLLHSTVDAAKKGGQASTLRPHRPPNTVSASRAKPVQPPLFSVLSHFPINKSSHTVHYKELSAGPPTSGLLQGLPKPAVSYLGRQYSHGSLSGPVATRQPLRPTVGLIN